MLKWMHRFTLILLIASLALTTACGGRDNKKNSSGGSAPPSPNQDQAPAGSPSAAGTGGVTMLGGGTDARLQDGAVPIRSANGEDYVDAEQLMKAIGYTSVWDDNHKVLKFGDNDAAFELKVDSTEARKEDDKVHLKKGPAVLDGAVHIPVSALADLLSDEVSFSKQGQALVLKPAPEQVNLDVDQDGPLPQGSALDFGDDPSDPYKNIAADAAASGLPENFSIDEDGAVPAAALKDINIPALIARARTYMGVKYLFGTGPYSETGRFDCSSYTAYLFGKYGISLPRTARAQAKLGNTVSRSNLRVGDLMFFYVPGRFQTNKTVGHVGIYIGNKNMIHSSPKPKNGVQITYIDKAYWKQTFLYAKRIAQ